nr:transcription factor BIM1 isoform X2 [Ipomoea batatas]
MYCCSRLTSAHSAAVMLLRRALLRGWEAAAAMGSYGGKRQRLVDLCCVGDGNERSARSAVVCSVMLGRRCAAAVVCSRKREVWTVDCCSQCSVMLRGYLRTHDFLQPLEQAEGTVGKEESKVEVTIAEKPPPPPSMEHNLPGGIGTYSISYLQRVPKPEGSLFAMAQPSSTDRNDENSNCSSYSGSGFTLWDETAVKKGKTGKENSSGERHVLRETGVNTGGQRPVAMEWPSQSSSNLKHSTAAFSSFSSSQFQMLRDIIPHSDQKRDKASFLLEVIEYIQFLQEKVQKHEGSYQSWEHEPTKLPWNSCSKSMAESNCEYAVFIYDSRSVNTLIKASIFVCEIEQLPKGAQGFIDHSQGTNNASDPALIFASKFADSKPGISRTIPVNGQKAEPDMSTALIKDGGHQHPCLCHLIQTYSLFVGQKHSITTSAKTSVWLLSTLTTALQSSGVDLSQASISVHIDLGKRANGRLNSSASTIKIWSLFRTSLVGQKVVFSTDPEVNHFIFQQEGKLFPAMVHRECSQTHRKTGINGSPWSLPPYLKNLILTLVSPENLKASLLSEMDHLTRKHLHSWTALPKFDVKEATETVHDIQACCQESFQLCDKRAMELRHCYRAFIDGFISFPLNIPGTAHHASMREVDDETTFLTEQIAVDLMFVLLFATYETTSAAITLALNFLNQHPQALRQLQGQELHSASKKFMAFGGGQRLCAGADFAKLGMAILLHYLVTNYRWKVVEEGKIVRTPALLFPNGFQIQLTSLTD